VIVFDWSRGEGERPRGFGRRPVILIGGPYLLGGAFLSLLDSSFPCVSLSLYIIMTCGPSLVIS
jgi:hypothetical protein